MHETEGMKREQEDDNEMNSPTKRSRNDDDDSRTDLRLLIPSKNAGAVIGKGGSNITRLRTEFKASVTVPDCPGPERVLTISADLETALEILMDIIPKLDDNVSHGSREFECEIRILVHQSHAGCIIGRAGFKIKELREQTGATIKVYSQCCPQSTDRVVQLSGKPEVVVDGVRRVYALIEQSPIKGPRNPYDPHNYDSFYQEEYGGFIDPMARGGGGGGGRMDMGRMGPGSRGPHSMGSRGSFGGMNEFPRRMGRGESGFGGGSGGAGVGGGRGGIMGRGNRGFRNGSGGGYNDYYPRRGGGQRFGNDQGGSHFGRMGGAFNYEGGPGSNDFTNDSFPHTNPPVDDANASTTQVTVPKDLAGSIIGKGGARIRKIRHDSGASIIIDEAVPGSAERVITISGSPQQIQMAQYLLQQSVRDHSGGGSM